MTDIRTLIETAESAVRARLREDGMERILVEPATDSEGADALRITVVLTAAKARQLTGDQALDLLVEVQQAFRDKGEVRLPIIEYATEQELAADRELDEVETPEGED